MISHRDNSIIREIPRLYAVRAGSRLGVRLDAEPGAGPAESAVLLIERAGWVIEAIIGVQPIVRPGSHRECANEFIIPSRDSSHECRCRLDSGSLRRVQLHRPHLVALLV